ncbi:uncharacterized protein ACR2FA_011129 [Aphomia sociella]
MMLYLTPLLFISIIGFTNAAAQRKVPFPPEVAAEIIQAATQCLSETGVNPELLMKFAKFDGKNIIQDEELNKIGYCTLVKSGYGKGNGRVKIDKVLSIMPKDVDKDNLRKVMEECNKETGKDVPDTVYMIFKCFADKSPVIMSIM